MPQPHAEHRPPRTPIEASPLSWADPSALMWGPFLSGFQTWNGVMSAVNREWLAFINRRLQHDATLPPALAACHTPDEMWRVMAEFYRKLLEDYQRELGELARLSSSAASATFRAMEHSVEAEGGPDAAPEPPPRPSRH